MYGRAVTSVRTSGGVASEFIITTRGLHQGSALSSYQWAH